MTLQQFCQQIRQILDVIDGDLADLGLDNDQRKLLHEKRADFVELLKALCPKHVAKPHAKIKAVGVERKKNK